MDLVPSDFSERVTAAWKCCNNDRFRCKCVTNVFLTYKWTFPKATNATFSVVPYARGEWKYNFQINYGIEMTMSELLEHPDFKNLRIYFIRINGIHEADKMKPVNDVGMEKLLKFVSFLSNEPGVSINSQNTNDFSSPEGAVLFTWLEQRWFSEINFWTYRPEFNRLLQKQTSRRSPTNIKIFDVIGDTELFVDQLSSGQMTRFRAHHNMFSSDVMEGIIQSFLRNPSAKMIDIATSFDDSTEGHLMEMAVRGLCGRVEGKFIFENPFHRLKVSPHSCDVYVSEWTCVTT